MLTHVVVLTLCRLVSTWGSLVSHSPMGNTLVMYSRAVMLCDLTTRNTRTASTPTKEQKPMCHSVRAIGKGKPLYARSHLLKRMTEHEMLIHMST